MRWTLRFARDGFSVDAARKKKRPLPQWYLDEPADPMGAELFYVAYRDLATCRKPDGPIPWDATMAYADRKGLRPDVADALWTVIRKMDLAHTEWQVEQLKGTAGGG